MPDQDWREYEPPAEELDEHGAPKLRETLKLVVFVLLGLFGFVALIVGFGLLERSGVNLGHGALAEEDPVDRSILDAAFLDESLAEADASFGSEATEISLDPFRLVVEYVDPDTKVITFVTFDDDVEGYSVDRLDPRDYDPPTFDLADVSGAELVAAADRALGQADDPYDFDVVVSADDTGAATAETTVRDEGVDEPITSTLPLS